MYMISVYDEMGIPNDSCLHLVYIMRLYQYTGTTIVGRDFYEMTLMKAN